MVRNGVETSPGCRFSLEGSSSWLGLWLLLFRFVLAFLILLVILLLVIVVVAIDLASTFGGLLALKHLFPVGLLVGNTKLSWVDFAELCLIVDGPEVHIQLVGLVVDRLC